jgi:hypothetical protein
VVESFCSTLKLELNLDEDRDVMNSPQQLWRDLAFWIEGSYNFERRHSLWVISLRAAGCFVVLFWDDLSALSLAICFRFRYDPLAFSGASEILGLRICQRAHGAGVMG